MLEALQDIEIASRLVGFDADSDDSLDEKYKKLRCCMNPLLHGSEDYRLIEKFLLTTHAPTHTDWSLELEEVFSLEREGELDKYAPCDHLNIFVPASDSIHATSSSIVDPKVLLELFSMYREWQEENVKKLSQKQEEIENKIEIADALSVKLRQRFNYSVTAMKTSSQHLCGVHALQVEIGELKGRLTEVISNCDAVCKRISAEGPESLRSSVKPLVICTAHQEHQS